MCDESSEDSHDDELLIEMSIIVEFEHLKVLFRRCMQCSAHANINKCSKHGVESVRMRCSNGHITYCSSFENRNNYNANV